MPTPDGYAKPLRLAALAAALAGFLGGAPTALAATAEALNHAQTIEAAWQRLEDHIRLRSSAPTAWPGATPPAATGWQADWTERGLGALYCGQVLVVFAAATDLKGVGADQRAVRLAPHIEAARTHDAVPPLHWLEAGAARGILGRASVTLPACMAGALPEGRVALAGEVIDPLTVRSQVLTPERQNRPCPAATHGTGQAWVRDLVQEVNGRGAAVGNPVPGAWRLLVDHCVPDYTEWVHFRQPCTFTPGPPHQGTLTGETVWRRQRAVTAAGQSWRTPPQFVSTSCWTDPNPTPPVPRDWSSTTTSSRTVGCAAGFIGSRTQRRTLTWFNRQWPWDAAPTTRLVSTGSWTTTATSCRLPPPPPPPPPPPVVTVSVTTTGNSGGGDTTTVTPTRTPTPPPPRTPTPCVDRDKGGGCPSSGNGGNDRGGNDPDSGIDVNFDGRADYHTMGQVPAKDLRNARSVNNSPTGGGGGGPGDRGKGPAGGIGRGDSDRGRG